MTTAAVYRIPLGYILDADSRGIIDAQPAHQTRSAMWLALDADTLASLTADAAHYADPDQAFEPRLAGAARSFLAAVAQGPVVRVPAARARRLWRCPGCGVEQVVRPAHRLCLDCR